MKRVRAAVLVAAVLMLPACSGSSTSGRATTRPPSATATVTTQAQPSPPASTTRPPTPSTSRPSMPHASPTHHPTPTPRHAAAPVTHAPTGSLPLRLPTSTATQVITVTASSTGSTTATLRAWQRSGSGWRAVGPAVHAWLGSAGMSTHASESSTATPIGSFTLTQAFGHDADPGTALPYTRTTPDDWWVSQAGALYNTRQRCASSCAFVRGAPNEHLYYELPFYDYAVVIDYNTRNAPGGVRAGAGSAFFLHVTVGAPTQGCVSIPADQLVRLLRWLSPAARPRILIGVA